MMWVDMPEPGYSSGTFLAFDFGKRRIGVAVGQVTTRTASALVTVNNATEPDWPAISKLMRDWRPAGLVVGLPLDAEGGITDISRSARAFGRQLETRFKLPVYYMDERLTSAEAGGEFAQARAQGRARRKDISRLDAVAAKIILENWLQSLPTRLTDSGPG